MDTAARLALSVRRYEVARFTILVSGIDLTGVNMAMQVRLRPDTPGAPLLALGTVSTLSAEGLKLDSVATIEGVPTSIVKVRINASTMQDADKLPYSGEVGDDTTLAYAMQWTLNGDAQTRLYGDFIVQASAFGSDSAPANRPPNYSTPPTSGGSNTGSLTFGDQVVRVSIDGADLLGQIISGAGDAADRAEAAALSVAATQALLDSSNFAELSSRLWPDALTVGPGEFVLDNSNLYGAGTGIFVPRALAMRRGQQAISAAPIANAESTYRLGHSFLARAPGATGVLWYDGRTGVNQIRFTDVAGFIANLIDVPGGAFDEAIVLATFSGDDTITSPIQWRRGNEQVGMNQAPWGVDIAQAPYRFQANTTSVVPITDATLAGLGLASGITRAGDVYVGGPIASAVDGGHAFFRVFLQSSVDDSFANVGINLWDSTTPEGGGVVSAPSMQLERRFSARARSYILSIDLPTGIKSFSIGTSSPAGAVVAMAGIQYAAGNAPSRFIRFADFAVADADLPVDLALPAKLFLRANRPLPINVCNALANIDAMDGQVASIASASGGADTTSAPGAPLLISGADTLLLDPTRMGATAVISVQSRRGVSSWKRKGVGVAIGTRTAAIRLACIGDSKTNRLLAAFAKDKYANAGGTITTIGTITHPARTDAPHEGREGWQFGDFTHQDARYAAATGLSPSYTASLTQNPFIRPAVGGDDAALVKNGYVFDYRYYLNGLGYADPTHVTINLGVNDIGINVANLALATSQIANGMAIMYRQIRAALPNAKISFATWALGSPGARWDLAQALIIKPHIAFVAAQGDANLDYIAYYLHEDRRTAFPAAVNSTDAWGLATVGVGDATHEDQVNKSAAAEALLGWLSQ